MCDFLEGQILIGKDIQFYELYLHRIVFRKYEFLALFDDE